jgi:hypothetical protein
MAFLRVCLWIGVVADLLASIPLLFPEIAKLMFGLQTVVNGNDYLYVSRIGASLMLGWTFLLAWGSLKPVERKGVILLTVVPVLAGLLGSSVLAVQSGFIRLVYMLPLWIFYVLIIPLYVIAYAVAVGVEKNHFKI